MSILETILTGGVGQLVKDIVGTFKLSPAAKLELEKQIEEHQFELAKIDADLESKLVDAAAGNIQAEAKANWYTASARPTFMYVVEFILVWNFVAVPLFHGTPVPLPDPLFWLFGSCVLGYVGARSWEKISGVFDKK